MKKFFSRIIVVLCICVCCIFGACEKDTVEGTYKFKSISYQENGNTVELQIGDKYTDGTLLSEDFLVLTLAKGGIAYLFMEDNQSVVGTWNILCHNNIDVTFNRETVIFKKDKTSLSGEIDGKNILLKKVI